MPVVAPDASTASNNAMLLGASVSTAQKKFGAGSLECSATGYAKSMAAVYIGGDFTVEGWAYYSGAGASTQHALFSLQRPNSNLQLFIRANAGNVLGLFETAVGLIVNGSTAVPTGAWFHWAVTRSGSTTTVWLNGVSQGTSSSTYAMQDRVLALGSYALGIDWLNGFLDDVRLTIGVARYTAPFSGSLPSAAFPTGGGDGSWASVVTLLNFDATAASTALVKPVAGAGVLSLGLEADARLKSAGAPVSLRDLYFGGTGKVPGDAALDEDPDVPVRRKVWLVRTRDALVIREQWSHPVTGVYSFNGIDPAQKYAVVAFDHTGVFNAVIADNITPEPM